jgi:hypothetical protein
VLYEIEQKMLTLEDKGLSLAMFDHDKSQSLLEEMKKDCQHEGARRSII